MKLATVTRNSTCSNFQVIELSLTSSTSLRFYEPRAERKTVSKILLALTTKHKVLRGLRRDLKLKESRAESKE